MGEVVRLQKGKSKKPSVMLNQGLPYHTESEQVVLGCLILDPTFTVPHVLGYLQEEDFYIEAHKTIFRACQKLHKENLPIDTVTVIDLIQGDPSLKQVGGASYVGELVAQVPTVQNVQYYAKRLRVETERRNRILNAVKDIEDAYEEEVLPKKSYTPVSEVIESVLEDIYAPTDRMHGFSTGFWEIDSYLDGLVPGRLYVIGGRPSHGKSALSTQIALHIKNSGGRVVFFPLETGKKMFAKNLLAVGTQTPYHKLKAGEGKKHSEEEIDNIVNFMRIQKEGHFFVGTARSPQRIEQTLKEILADKGGFDVLFIDHLQEMVLDGDDRFLKRHYQIEKILQSLRKIAREFEIPVVLCAQLGRSAEGKKPTLAEIKDSGSIEQIADVILLIHAESRGSGWRNIEVAKNRYGHVGELRLYLRGECLKFEDPDIPF